MRVAIVSDIHGNLTALEAVLADLRRLSPDMVYHLGDLVTHGHRPGDVLELVRQAGWQGVVGNTDEMLWRPDRLPDLVARAPKLRVLLEALFHDLAPATRDCLRPGDLEWLQSLPPTLQSGDLFLLHASPGDLWRAPLPDATSQNLESVYESLGARTVVYGHIHRPYVRSTGKLTVANTGSVGLPYDGDPSASYLLVEDGHCHIRRVEYEVEREAASLLASGYPRAEWLAGMLRTARYAPPV